MKKFIFCLWMVFLSINIYADSYVTLYTKCGKPIQGIVPLELSDEEITESNSFFISTFPNATYLNSSTRTYNCHSYAWNIKEGGSICWINATINIANDNISKYWTGDYYSSTAECNAQKIFYYQSDHSAIVSSIAGMYESKWGSAPLMRHAPTYGPYANMNKRNYYKHNHISEVLVCSNGIGPTSIGVSSSYLVKNSNNIPYGPYVQKEWMVLDAKGEEVIGTKANIITSGDIATISFRNKGIYEIYYTISLIGAETLNEYWFEAIVE